MLDHIKKFIKTRNSGPFLSSLLSGYLRFVELTSKQTHVNELPFNSLMQSKKSFIIAMWHGQIPFFLWGWSKQKPAKLTAFISSHRDGRVMGLTMARFGHNLIEFNKKEPHKGIIRATKLLKENDSKQQACYLAFAPDGPRGPAEVVKPGIFMLASRANVPIIPISANAKYGMSFNSWDKMRIPLPFNHIYIKWGTPIEVEGKTTDQIQEALNHQLQSLKSDVSTLMKE